MRNTRTTILVVGGAGYIGSVLTHELVSRGYGVRVLDSMYFGDQGLCAVRDRIELIVADMRSVSSLIMDGVTAVINLGGLSNDPTAEYNPKANYEMNTVAAFKLAEVAKQSGVRRYIFASTCSIYDRGSTAEPDVISSEHFDANPTTAYSRSKYLAERLVKGLADDRFCPIILRKGTVYGFSPRMRYDLVVNTFVKDALSTGILVVHHQGTAWRPLVDVRDVARAYIAAVEAPDETVRGEIINVASANVRISELAIRVKQVLSAYGLQAEIRLGDDHRQVRNYRVSTQKSEHLLAFKPTVSIEESVVDMVRRIQEYGYTDFENPRYSNIRWMRLREGAAEMSGVQ